MILFYHEKTADYFNLVRPVFIYAQASSDTIHNAVKTGKAVLQVDVLCFSDSVDRQKSLDEIYKPIEIYAISTPIFDYNNKYALIPMKRDSIRYYAEVPVERLEEIGGIKVKIDSPCAQRGARCPAREKREGRA